MTMPMFRSLWTCIHCTRRLFTHSRAVIQWCNIGRKKIILFPDLKYLNIGILKYACIRFQIVFFKTFFSPNILYQITAKLFLKQGYYKKNYLTIPSNIYFLSILVCKVWRSLHKKICTYSVLINEKRKEKCA